MIDDIGILRISIELSSTLNPDRRVTITDVMVDTGSEYNWFPEDVLADIGVAPVRVDRFETADGRILERAVGFALIYASGRSTATVVVFAGPGEMTLLGAIGLEGMNLRIDPARRALSPAGPVPVAAAA
jgi:predicted aspartyl protease